MSTPRPPISIPESFGLRQLENRIADIFSGAIICKITGDQLNDRLAYLIHEPLNYKSKSGRRKHSVWFCGYAAGFIAAHRADIWRNHVEFCYVKDGVLFSTHRDSTHRKTEEFYAAGKGHELGKLPCAHFWKGTDKPFGRIEGLK